MAADGVKAAVGITVFTAMAVSATCGVIASILFIVATAPSQPVFVTLAEVGALAAGLAWVGFNLGAIIWDQEK